MEQAGNFEAEASTNGPSWDSGAFGDWRENFQPFFFAFCCSCMNNNETTVHGNLVGRVKCWNHLLKREKCQVKSFFSFGEIWKLEKVHFSCFPFCESGGRIWEFLFKHEKNQMSLRIIFILEGEECQWTTFFFFSKKAAASAFFMHKRAESIFWSSAERFGKI